MTEPELIHDIFLGKPGAFAKRKAPDAEQAYLGQISSFSPLFKTLVMAAPLMLSAVRHTQQRWSNLVRQHGPLCIDMYREMGQITLDSRCSY